MAICAWVLGYRVRSLLYGLQALDKTDASVSSALEIAVQKPPRRLITMLQQGYLCMALHGKRLDRLSDLSARLRGTDGSSALEIAVLMSKVSAGIIEQP